MKDIAHFRIVPEKQVANLVSRGWRILEQKGDSTYSVGLPIERAYQDAVKIIKQLSREQGLTEHFKRRAASYGKNFFDYESVAREKINKYSKDDSYTHVIDSTDKFNKEINDFFGLFPGYFETVYAVPRKITENDAPSVSENTPPSPVNNSNV